MLCAKLDSIVFDKYIFLHNLRVLYVEVGFCGAESKLAKSDNQADSASHRNKNNL